MLIPVGLWLKFEFKMRYQWAKGPWRKLKEIVVVLVIGLLGLAAGLLLENFSGTFAGVEARVMGVLTLVALLPVAGWIKFVYAKRIASIENDSEKKREKWILLIVFLLGTLTVPILNLFYNYLDAHPTLNYYNSLQKYFVGPAEFDVNNADPYGENFDMLNAVYEQANNLYRTITIIIDALLEEIVKISLMIFFVRTMKLVRTIGDAITFSVLSGLGFAFIENIVYFVNIYNDPSKDLSILVNVMIFRMIVLNIGHMTFSGIFGYFYGLSRFALPVYEEERWEGMKFPMLRKIAALFHTSINRVFAGALVYEGAVIAMLTHATFNTFIEFNARDYAIYLVMGTSLYVYYLTQRKAGHLVLATLGRHRMSLMAPRDEDVILELAGMWITEGKYKEVEEICARLEAKDPDNAVIKLLYAKAHDKRRVKRAGLALKSLFYQEDIFEEDVSLFEKFKQVKDQRGDWKPGDATPDPFKPPLTTSP